MLDNFSTGKLKNISEFIDNKRFKLIEGDIRDINKCLDVCKDIDYVLHQAALGSVPRSIKDPKTTNEAALMIFKYAYSFRDRKVKRFVYAASSSTYGDSKIT